MIFADAIEGANLHCKCLLLFPIHISGRTATTVKRTTNDVFSWYLENVGKVNTVPFSETPVPSSGNEPLCFYPPFKCKGLRAGQAPPPPQGKDSGTRENRAPTTGALKIFSLSPQETFRHHDPLMKSRLDVLGAQPPGPRVKFSQFLEMFF